MNRTVVDLFAGGGGLSLGFEMASFTILLAIENDSRALSTYRHNRLGVSLMNEDISRLEPEECLQASGLSRDDVGVLVGGPPCKGFSESNRRTRSLDNAKNFLYREFLRFLAVLRPPWFVLENVIGIRTLAGGIILRDILERSHRLGYSVTCRELNAADFGVPQIRRRIFVVGNRLGACFRFPELICGPDLRPYVTVRDAIADLPHLENGAGNDVLPYRIPFSEASTYQQEMRGKKSIICDQVQGNLVTNSSSLIVERYRHIRPGQNWESIPGELMANYSDRSRCHTGIYYRLCWDRPSRVIGNFRKNMLVHPVEDRGLSVREAARLQSFPDHYEFTGSIGFQQQQVADAVPPLLASAVAGAVLRCQAKLEQTVGP